MKIKLREPSVEYLDAISDDKPREDVSVEMSNVYVDLHGRYQPLPFEGGEGVWSYDGQYFYKSKNLL